MISKIVLDSTKKIEYNTSQLIYLYPDTGATVQINYSFTNTSSYTGGLMIYWEDQNTNSHNILNITSNSSGTIYTPFGFNLYVFIYDNNYPIPMETLTTTNPTYSLSAHGGISRYWTVSSTSLITITAGITN